MLAVVLGAVAGFVARRSFVGELLIIDGGSTDNAVKAITNIDDARIRIIRDGTNKD